MKIYVFGCSFTKYIWPTWADILQNENTDIEFYNFALPGIGNRRIFLRIQELFLKGKISSNDKILVLWTSWHREDRFVNNKWANEGNIFASKSFDNTFIKKYWNEDFDVINNASSIISANNMFNIDFNGIWLDVGNAEQYNNCNVPETNLYKTMNDKFEFYNSKLPKFTKFNHSKNTNFFGQSSDGHPDILCHCNFASAVADKLDLKNCHRNIDYWTEIQTITSNMLAEGKTWKHIQEYFGWQQQYNDPMLMET